MGKRVNNITDNDWKAEQRKQAVELYMKGYKQAQIAKILNVTQASISLWVTKSNKFGLDILKTKYSPGAPAKLTKENKQELLKILRQPPTKFGFTTEFWLRKYIVEVIKQTFNVCYHPSQVSRILKEIGWTNK